MLTQNILKPSEKISEHKKLDTHLESTGLAGRVGYLIVRQWAWKDSIHFHTHIATFEYPITLPIFVDLVPEAEPNKATASHVLLN